MKRLIFENEDTRLEVFRNIKKEMVISVIDQDDTTCIPGLVHVFDNDVEFEQFIIEAERAFHE